jgi:hypothetical protein
MFERALRSWWVCNPSRNRFRILHFWFWFRVKRLTFWSVFSFKMWSQPWCVQKHATDPSIAMHGVVRILFVLCLVSVLEQGEYCASESLAENWCNLQVKAIHSMRHHASRCWPRENRGQDTVANIVGIQVPRMSWRVWFASRLGLSSQTNQLDWDTVCWSGEPQVHVIYRTRWSFHRRSCSRTWYTRCVARTCTVFAINTLLPHWEYCNNRNNVQ